jgi:hypothetical protein
MRDRFREDRSTENGSFSDTAKGSVLDQPRHIFILARRSHRRNPPYSACSFLSRVVFFKGSAIRGNRIFRQRVESIKSPYISMPCLRLFEPAAAWQRGVQSHFQTDRQPDPPMEYSERSGNVKAETWNPQELINRCQRRRALLRALNSGTAVTNPARSEGNRAIGQTDAALLNFALNIEYLKAEFYTYATTGRGIDAHGVCTDGIGSCGSTTGGRRLDFTLPTLEATACELARDERQHISILRAALGGAAVAKPAIKLDALGMGFSKETEFLAIARMLEETGVCIYGTTASLIGDRSLLQATAQILAAETFHAGSLRLLIDRQGVSVPELAPYDASSLSGGERAFSTDVACVPPELPEVVRPFFSGPGNGIAAPLLA